MKGKKRLWESGSICLDWKDLSEDGFNAIQSLLKRFGLHLGDVEEEINGESRSDSWIIYISKKKITKSELKKDFPEI